MKMTLSLAMLVACSSKPAPAPASANTFTLGSTEAEVKAAMGGAPTELDDTFHQWEYGFSIVKFDGSGHVVGWNERDTHLATRYEPQDPKAAEAARAAGTFGKGSTKDEVFGVMGVPTEIDATFDQWEYGFSIVHFSGSRVTGWNERDTHLPVR